MADPRRSPQRSSGVLAGPIEGHARIAAQYPALVATVGLRVLHRASGFLGVFVRVDDGHVVLRSPSGLERRYLNAPGTFAVEGQAVRLVGPPADTTEDRADEDGTNRTVAAGVLTASGSRSVVRGARARVARASRILVEGVHDAELVEQVWGDDLRIEGVVVERLDGADHLADEVAGFRPGPGRRLGVLLDHLVPGSKESRLAAAVAHPHVLVTGTPYVDIWQAVRPAAVGIPAWPEVPKGVEWKVGVCERLGVSDPRELWRRVLRSVGSWKDLEQPLVAAVEQLVDFVTEPATSGS